MSARPAGLDALGLPPTCPTDSTGNVPGRGTCQAISGRRPCPLDSGGTPPAGQTSDSRPSLTLRRSGWGLRPDPGTRTGAPPRVGPAPGGRPPSPGARTPGTSRPFASPETNVAPRPAPRPAKHEHFAPGRIVSGLPPRRGIPRRGRRAGRRRVSSRPPTRGGSAAAWRATRFPRFTASSNGLGTGSRLERRSPISSGWSRSLRWTRTTWAGPWCSPSRTSGMPSRSRPPSGSARGTS